MPLYQKVIAIFFAILGALAALVAVVGLLYAVYRTIRYRLPVQVNVGVTIYNHIPQWRRLWAERKGGTVTPEQMDALYASSERTVPRWLAIVIGIGGALAAFYVTRAK